MKRYLVMVLLLVIGSAGLGVVVAQNDEKLVDIEKLEDNLFVLRGEGGGGNTAVFMGTAHYRSNKTIDGQSHHYTY